MFKRRKAALDEKYAKGSQRDWGQVLANGGLGTLLIVFYWLYPTQVWLWVAFVGALAAVNADTWATELGVYSRSAPRLITTGKTVERGTSGGVSGLGYLAVLSGSAFIGLVSLAVFPTAAPLGVFAAALFGGLVGSTVDSLLGATWQAVYTCPNCRKETERHPLHSCGAETTRLRGLSWLNNDWVNFACSLGGAVTAAAAWLLLTG
jgi:uncharacterized protein (TIGR00297 family)